jgi:hypothetical protein
VFRADRNGGIDETTFRELDQATDGGLRIFHLTPRGRLVEPPDVTWVRRQRTWGSFGLVHLTPDCTV